MTFAFFGSKRLPPPFGPRKPLVSVLRLTGVIGAGGPMGRGLSLASIAGSIERAFQPKKQAAVALLINSPGGSPVQSALIARRIRDLAEEKGVPVLAFCEDVAASGGYWLATAADEIFADSASIVGSIGVLSSGFGFSGLLDRFGIERRLYTAGEKKVLNDPFQPERPEGVDHLKTVLVEIHDDFKSQVRARRGDRLKGDEATLFSGAFWTARTALELGLVDGLGHIRPILRERFGKDVRLRVVGEKRGFLKRLLPRGAESRLADALVDAMMSGVEERVWWTRYGR